MPERAELQTRYWLCGCNDDEACEEGCDWANEEKTVCTACVAKEAARAAV